MSPPTCRQTAPTPSARDPAVRSVTVDRRGSLQGLDPALGYDVAGDDGSLYDVAQVTHAKDAWTKGWTGKGVDVALVDSGVAPVQGLTSGNVVQGPDLSFESQDPTLVHRDTFGHGTHMASIIAGRDAAGTGATYARTDTHQFTGVAPDARLVSVKVAAADGGSDVSQVIAAIDWVTEHAHDPGHEHQGAQPQLRHRLDPVAGGRPARVRGGERVARRDRRRGLQRERRHRADGSSPTPRSTRSCWPSAPTTR